MNETEVSEFWNAHPCGDHIVGGLHGEFADDYQRFFAAYDAWRYDQERHIPACLDRFDFRDKRVLEIGLGQGAESEQLIRRGARWSGLDLTDESVERVRARLELRALPYDNLQQGSALDIPSRTACSTSCSATGCYTTSQTSTQRRLKSTGCSGRAGRSLRCSTRATH